MNIHLTTSILLILVNSIKTDLDVISSSAKYEEEILLWLNASVEYILNFPESKELDPYRVKAWSIDATHNLPVLLVVRQAKAVTSWTVPELIETTKTKRALFFSNTSRLMCHDSMYDIVNLNPDFSIEPLVISQSFILAVSTSSPTNVSVNLKLEKEKEFYVKRDVKYELTVSPSRSKYVYFKFDNSSSDTVVIEVDSDDDVCLTVSVQDSRCPVMDSNRDIKYEGVYQTVNRKGALTISKHHYSSGFFLVFVAKPDNYECSQESNVIPLTRMSSILENNITTILTFSIKNSITLREYGLASVGVIVILTLFGILVSAIIMVFNRFGTISKREKEKAEIKDFIEPITDEEINKIILSKDLTVDTFAKYPQRIKQRSFNYLSHTSSIALFYSIPVIQLVVTYQRVVNMTGNQDLCYYNFLCAHPAFGFSDFNHIFSNVGYIIIGLFFIIAVIDRQHIIKITKEKGIPVHYGLFYAMGVALIIEGILSACYHICPSQSNYQFDTSFMYIMAVLIMVKLYQNRHPDINATAYTTFSVIGVAIFIAMIGILDGTLFIWIFFIVAYSILIVLLSFKIYYVNYVINGMKQFYKSYKEIGFAMETFSPLRKGRFFPILLTNLANFSMLGFGLYMYFYNITDFGTFLLGLLLGNTVIHISFYTLMKLIHKERICIESIIFGALGLGFWIASGIFFLDAATLWTVTPAESRQWNQGCIFMNFFDKHDVWHLLSAKALYFTFLYLMYLDDDLCGKPQRNIPVF
ncbi:hypothetical protein GWI33_014926 [Rhynchophorus ferrugineus]|uniref:SID1 transmembrane family member 1-like n=1 Tax=Rhynchophorus ferrugineus TaxID=354439 RepID=A0A834MA80_RHYFE|nr:hypothetical protein GWI33_014926 [Rhynchophorus ferrugineus]